MPGIRWKGENYDLVRAIIEVESACNSWMIDQGRILKRIVFLASVQQDQCKYVSG